MNDIFIEKTKSTPEINFQAKNARLNILGSCYPENPRSFFDPILKWLDEFLSGLNDEISVKVNLDLPYINTASTKYIYCVLEKLQNSYVAGKTINVTWYYRLGDDSELENIEDFVADILIPVKILGIKS